MEPNPLALLPAVIELVGSFCEFLSFLYLGYEFIDERKRRWLAPFLRIATPMVLGILPGVGFVLLAQWIEHGGLNLGRASSGFVDDNLRYSSVIGSLLGLLTGLFTAWTSGLSSRSRSAEKTRKEHRVWSARAVFLRSLVGAAVGLGWGYVLSRWFGYDQNNALFDATATMSTGLLVGALFPIVMPGDSPREPTPSHRPRRPIWRAVRFGLLFGIPMGIIDALSLYIYPDTVPSSATPGYWAVSLFTCPLHSGALACSPAQWSVLERFLTYLALNCLVFSVALGAACGLWVAVSALLERSRERPFARKELHHAPGALFGALYGLLLLLLAHTIVTQPASPWRLPHLPVLALLALSAGLVVGCAALGGGIAYLNEHFDALAGTLGSLFVGRPIRRTSHHLHAGTSPRAEKSSDLRRSFVVAPRATVRQAPRPAPAAKMEQSASARPMPSALPRGISIFVFWVLIVGLYNLLSGLAMAFTLPEFGYTVEQQLTGALFDGLVAAPLGVLSAVVVSRWVERTAALIVSGGALPGEGPGEGLGEGLGEGAEAGEVEVLVRERRAKGAAGAVGILFGLLGWALKLVGPFLRSLIGGE